MVRSVSLLLLLPPPLPPKKKVGHQHNNIIIIINNNNNNNNNNTHTTTHNNNTNNSIVVRAQFCLEVLALRLSCESSSDRDRQRDRETEKEDKTQVLRTICTSDTFHDVRRKKPFTFHNGFMYMYIFVIMNHGRHNIRNGIAWAQTGHGTFT